MLVAHTKTARLTAEFVGTFAFVAAGVASVITVTSGAGADPLAGLLIVALAHGLVIGTMITVTGHVSGGHLNPAVTIALLATGQKGVATSAQYVAAQLAGAIGACGFLRLVLPGFADSAARGVPGLGPDVEAWQGAAIEGVLTFMLVWVVFAVTVDRDGAAFHLGGLPIGFAVAGLTLMGGALTGASMNPARFLGPALISGTWSDWWLYLAAPIIGATAAALIYMRLLDPNTHEAPAELG